MSARWDDAVRADQREFWLGKTLAVLSLDVTVAFADDVGLERARLITMQPAIRQVLGPVIDAATGTPFPRVPAYDVLAAVDPAVRAFVLSFYDRVMRFSLAQDVALFCWGITLMGFVRDEAQWASLGLPKDQSERLRDGFWSSMDDSDYQERLDDAMAKPLSDWDRRIAVARLLPAEDEGDLGLGDQDLRHAAQAIRRLTFWRLAATLLGEQGLDVLRAKCQAFLETQPDIAPAFGQLYDPHILAHPENPVGDPLRPV